MKNNWLWKLLLVPAGLVLILGLIGVLYPEPYMQYYLQQSADTTLSALQNSQPQVALLLNVMFRANGLGMTMSGILAIFILLYAFRRGEKWSKTALVISFGIGLIGEILLEIMVL